jgi:hypothetical protein
MVDTVLEALILDLLDWLSQPTMGAASGIRISGK